MWKNRKTAKKLKNVFCSYKICGYNLDGLINALYKCKIKLYNVKKDGKILSLTVKRADEEKLFAITKKLCYNNIVKVGESGKSLFIPFLLRNTGVIIGAIILFISAIFFDDILLDFSYTGSGRTEYQEIERALYIKGVKKFSRFSEIDIPILEDELLSETDSFSFISLKKQGNRLVIESALNSRRQQIQNGNAERIISPFSGVVKSVTVYRGTATVVVGDRVEKGDLLVDGYMTIKESITPCNVLAVITVEEEKKIELYFDDFVDKKYVGTLIDGLYEDADDKRIILKRENGKYKYVVKLYYLRRITE
ncbi:MAG: sporulation protein YqfD [Clostridia bacterium]|nr:sporulation protein YqfD [Clostridia bacterium]